MNPMSIFQMIRSGSPQGFLKQVMGNNEIMSNPMAKNAIDMAQKGDAKGIETLARNLCKEKGINPDEFMKEIKNNMIK